MSQNNKPSSFGSGNVRRYVRNAFNTFSSATSLKQTLFSKLNRHEPLGPLNTKKKPSKHKAKSKGPGEDFSDARYYEHFATHSSHFSSKNFI